MRTLKQLNVKNRKVLLRTGFDVPIKNGRVVDDSRISETLPTIKYLLKQKATVIILTHLGRPEGKFVSELSVKPVGSTLSKLLKTPVHTLADCIGIHTNIADAKPGKVYLLENLRFHKGEESNDAQFARAISSLGEAYVNDAFSVAHRKHASIVGIPKYLPSAAGLLMEKEVFMLSKLLKKPKHPYVAILGGAKVSDKIKTIKKILQKADILLIGGAMALSFYKSMGFETGKSKAEYYAKTKNLLNSKKIVLPIDFQGLIKNKMITLAYNSIPKEGICYDNGPETTDIFQEIIRKAKTIVWNGPMGLYEDKRFAESSEKIAKIIAKNKGLTIVGGGDTNAIIDGLKLAKKYSHVSTGGGAMLKFLEGKSLPGIKALEKTPKLP